MWKRLKQIAGFWGILSAIVGIFALGAGATYNLFMAFEPKGESTERAATVHQRVNELSARFDRLSTWAREQISALVGRQDRAEEVRAAEYRALNVRMDSQNALIMEVLRAVKEEKQAQGEPEPSDMWSLIGTARAAHLKNTENN